MQYWTIREKIKHYIETSFSEDDDSFSLPTPAKENSHNSSFEFIGSMIPSYQPCNKQVSRGGSFLPAAGGFRSPSPGFFKTSFISSASKVRLLSLSHINMMNKCVLSCHIFGKNNTRRRHLNNCYCMSKVSDKQTSLEFKMSLKSQREEAVI